MPQITKMSLTFENRKDIVQKQINHILAKEKIKNNPSKYWCNQIRANICPSLYEMVNDVSEDDQYEKQQKNNQKNRKKKSRKNEASVNGRWKNKIIETKLILKFIFLCTILLMINFFLIKYQYNKA